MNNIKINILFALLICAFLAACTPKNYNYLQDLKNGETISLPTNGTVTFEPQDKISVIVKGKIAELNSLFNHAVSTNLNAGSVQGSQYVVGYTLDNSGNIDFPLLGTIHLAGLTRAQAEQLVKTKLAESGLLKDATVTIDYMGLTYNVLGEVNSPGRKYITKDATTIFDALGDAGDINLYGKRDSVVVVRDNGQSKQVFIVNLSNAKDVYTSPAYFIHQNDLIYVKSNNMKIRQSTVNGNNTTNFAFWSSIASVLATIAVLIFK